MGKDKGRSLFCCCFPFSLFFSSNNHLVIEVDNNDLSGKKHDSTGSSERNNGEQRVNRLSSSFNTSPLGAPTSSSNSNNSLGTSGSSDSNGLSNSSLQVYTLEVKGTNDEITRLVNKKIEDFKAIFKKIFGNDKYINLSCRSREDTRDKRFDSDTLYTTDYKVSAEYILSYVGQKKLDAILVVLSEWILAANKIDALQTNVVDLNNDIIRHYAEAIKDAKLSDDLEKSPFKLILVNVLNKALTNKIAANKIAANKIEVSTNNRPNPK